MGETYREFSFSGAKVPIKGNDIGAGQIKLSHLHPSLYIEFLNHGNHKHDGNNTPQVSLRNINPEVKESGKSHYIFIGNLLIQWGWDFIQGDGTNRAIQQDVTFPLAYKTIPIVYVSNLGYKAGSDPTGPEDTGSVVAMTWDLGLYDTLMTKARVQLYRRSINGTDPGVFATAGRVLFSWYSYGLF